MGFFSRGKSGGMMNVIRCDEQDYMVWKWRPSGQDANSTSRENSIRWGSSLRVKDGEVAVFVYKQQNGTTQDFIEGPFDDIIKTANLPVLSSILGLAYSGDSPFQAEVYFINLQGNNQLKFFVDGFGVYDPRLPDHGIPVSVFGTMTFSLVNYKEFIKLNRLVNFSHEQFLEQVKDAIDKYVKGVITNMPQEMGIPAVHLERKILEVNQRVEQYLKPRIEGDFGVKMKALDISSMEIDKLDPTYKELFRLTAGNTAKTLDAQTEVNIKNMQDMQAINAANMEETLRVQREEMQRAQRLQTETNFMGAHALDQQTEVLKTGAQSLGQMGSMNMGGGGGSNPAGMMTGMMMGGAMGQQMAGMVNSMGQQMQNAMNTPPPIPNVQYHVSVNGMQMGPFNMQQLQQMAQSGQLTPQTYVWKQGMANWDFVCNVPELASLFAAPGTPPPPPPPPTM